MKTLQETDRTLLTTLPLPLAQAWRRALYAQTAAVVHERSLYALEATVKFVASVSAAAWIARGAQGDKAREACGTLVRPSLGHWISILRECTAGAPDDPLVSGWVQPALRAQVSQDVPGLSGKNLQVVFDNLPAYRNSISGHGAGLSATELTDRAPQLRALVRQVLTALVSDNAPRLMARTTHCIVRLTGPTALLESADEPPVPASTFLKQGERAIALSPLWIFDSDEDDVLVINKGAGLDKVEYLSYGTARSGSGLVSFKGDFADAAKRMLEVVTGRAQLQTTDIDQLITDAAVSELASMATGVRYGPFRVVRQIAAGGQGVLYEAIQESPPRRVALKTLSLQRALSPEARRRLNEEAAALAKVDHPSVVPVYETGETDGIPWIAMKFVEGKNLADIITTLRGRPSTASIVSADEWLAAAATQSEKHETDRRRSYAERMAKIARDAAEALAACHARGIVHRDVKPANLILDPHGRVILTDFGLARTIDSRSQTFTKQLVGTLQYLAPEALLPAGRGGPDARADIYGLGATLYEMLSLRRPFEDYERDEALLLSAVQSKEPRALRRVAPSVPKDLETVVMKAIERDRDRRYATAEEFAEDLERFLNGDQVKARPAGPLTRVQKWARRHPAWATALAASLLLLVMAGFWLKERRAQRLEAEQQAAQLAQQISYAEGSVQSALGTDRPEGEAYLDTEMLQEAQRHLRDAEKRIGDALEGPVSTTSLAADLKARYQQIAAQSAEVQSLAIFYEEADTAWFQIGAEHDEEARTACEAAVKSIGALDNAEWWKHLPVDSLHLQKSQLAQLQQDVYQQLILLAAMRAKPAALNMTASPDGPIRAAREALQQADRFQPSAGAALVDWFCRMRLGERDLPPLPEPKTGTDYFLLGIAHFWIAQFADTPLGGMVLAGAPRQSGIDLDAPSDSAIRLLRTAANLNPQQYWHNFTLAWALSTMGERAAGMAGAPLASSATPQSVSLEAKGGLPDSIASFLSPKKQSAATQADPWQQYFRDAELALNTCVALRPRFPVGYELRGRVMILEALGLKRLAERTDSADERAKLLSWAEKFQTQGLSDFDQAVRLDPNNPDTHWARGHCYELLAMVPEATADYAFALESDQPMKRITGQTWLGIADKFLTGLSQTDAHRDDANLLGLLALLALVRHQGTDAQASAQLLQQALDTANRALQIQADEPRALIVRGTARLERGEFDKALQDFDAVLKQKDRRNYFALIGRAQALEQLKQYDAASTAFAQVAGDTALPAWQRDQGRSGQQRCQEKLATNKISSS